MSYVICPTCLKVTARGPATCEHCGKNIAGAIAAPEPTKPGETPSVRVIVTDVDISFGQMFLLALKLTVAMIPVAFVWAILLAVLVGMMSGLPTR